MKNIFKNKFFIILSLFFILVFNVFTSCFATFNQSATLRTGDVVDVSLPDLPFDVNNSNYVVFYNKASSPSGYYCILFDDDNYFCKMNIEDNPSYLIYKLNFGVNDITSSAKLYHLTDDNWSLNRSLPDGTTKGLVMSLNHGQKENPTFQHAYIIYSTMDITDNNGNVVFSGAPVTVEQVTIPTITQAQEIPQAMSKVLQMIIPIGLIVFFSGLLIYLVRLVISRMT